MKKRLILINSARRQIKKIEKKETELSYLKKILHTDDEHFEGNDKLSHNVARVLEDLGFTVQKSDKISRNNKKKTEDLLVIDAQDEYKSLCEVKGTLSKNPSEHYVGQLTNHMRKNSDKTLKGLLIVNYDYNTHPYQRTKIYNDYNNGDEEGLLSADDITVISTVDLFKVIMDVRNNILTKEDARKITKEPYRIEYPKKQEEKEKQ